MRGRAVLRGGGRTFHLAAACWFITGCSGPVAIGQPEAQVDGAGTPPHSLSQLDTEFGEFDYRTWTVDDGLPENPVTSIVQTRDGYLWIGTFGGLARFDGVRFTVFGMANTAALGTNRILSLLEARNGDLWIGTENGGVVRLREGVFASYRTQENAPCGKIFSIVVDQEGVFLLRWLQKCMVDQETGERGFLIIGKDEFLTPFDEGQEQLQEAFSRLRTLVASAHDRTVTVNDLDDLDRLHDKWTKEAASAANLLQEIAHEQARV